LFFCDPDRAAMSLGCVKASRWHRRDAIGSALHGEKSLHRTASCNEGSRDQTEDQRRGAAGPGGHALCTCIHLRHPSRLRAQYRGRSNPTDRLHAVISRWGIFRHRRRSTNPAR
jgi:hypothetical protein